MLFHRDINEVETNRPAGGTRRPGEKKDILLN